ncbi:BACON domain-containing protein [Bacteroides finegoldii]|uniref:BACON domain-containing protein n=1 Tax=Bacteroides finegoldii TaxID=338188 RepID=UPI0018A06E22|nr:BACON domain-containing protein [Bacteroides finegoldii]
MRNIFLLLSCLLCLQACNDEKEVDWTPDALTVSCNETLEEAGDGHWKVTLPTEYKGTVKLEIQTDKAWEVAVNYMTTEEEKWITLSSEGGEGSASLSLVIADNKTAKDRKASVVISTKGKIPVKKTITVIQGNVDELLLVGTIDESSFPEDVFITTKADGSFDVTLPKDFTAAGERELNILTYQGTTSPVIDVTYPDAEQAGWVILTEVPVESVLGSETKTLALTIKENTANVYREALVNFTATAGDVISQKAVKIIQFGVEKIIWNEEYYQQEREFIISSDANEKLLVATCENINPTDLELKGNTSWLELSQEEGKIYAKVQKNESTNTERKTEVGIKNTKTSVETRVSLKQGMAGYGIVLTKSLWSIAAYSSNLQKQVNDGSIKKLFNNDWASVDNTSGKHVQFDGGSDSNPYVFTFDLGDNPHGYNSFGLMPRLQWTAPAPKTLKFEISDNLNDGWETVVAKSVGNGFTERELKYEGPYNGSNSNKYDNHYEGIVKWFKLSDEKMQKRYVRLSVYDTFCNPCVLCFDEVFASDRTNVQ